jgi:hypothetical protein
MTKAQAKKLLSAESDGALAKVLGVKRQAVSAWGKFIPQARQWQIEAMIAKNAGRMT